jgi:alpha-glucosidase (family GH31 glycosyl hydrolase)
MNMSIKTLAVSNSHYDGTLEYDVHNLYGMYESKATAEALRSIRQKRHFQFTRSAVPMACPPTSCHIPCKTMNP